MSAELVAEEAVPPSPVPEVAPEPAPSQSGGRSPRPGQLDGHDGAQPGPHQNQRQRRGLELNLFLHHRTRSDAILRNLMNDIIYIEIYTQLK